MKFALVGDQKLAPTPKESGSCLFCNAKVISKCGNRKAWHWAHKSELECDPWWENETEWHRSWKNKFPESWQERIQFDENGEKHIADVKTDEGWVLEFQHSPISSVERNTRNNFYKKLIWVVDGNRRKRDKAQFFKLIDERSTISTTPKIYRICIDDSLLLKDWANSPCPVFFDFGEQNLWCLIPSGDNSWAAVIEIPSSLLVSMHNRKDLEEEDFEGFIKSLQIVVFNYKTCSQSQTFQTSFPHLGTFHRQRLYIRRFRYKRRRF